MSTTMRARWIVESSAKMPSGCWGRYKRIGIVEVLPGAPDDVYPKRIADTRWCRVVATWERRHDGKTTRCAAYRAYQEALAQVEAWKRDQARKTFVAHNR